MGVIRFLLAMSVVVYHSNTLCGERFIGGTAAVQAFYILSGFYMAMILNEKYRPGPGSFRLFITNRFLRLYPAYWVVLLLSVGASFVAMQVWNKPMYLYGWNAHSSYMGWGVVMLAVVANLFIFGSDVMMFTGVDPGTGHLAFTHDPFQYKPMTMHLLFVPQVWTLGVELMFYLIAPFLVRRKVWILLIIIAASLTARFVVYRSPGYNVDPWTYRFFPFEIALFLGGSVCYKFYKWIEGRKLPAWVPILLWASIPFSIVYYPHAEWLPETQRCWWFYVQVLVTLPFIFHYTRRMKWDRWIGELSFPLYIGHHLVMMLFKPWFWSHATHMAWFGWCTVTGSVLLAVVLWLLVMRPVEKLRQRRVAVTH